MKVINISVIIFALGSNIFMIEDSITEVHAIVGQSLFLACDFAANLRGKEGVILWFKDNMTLPIYRRDLRITSRPNTPDFSSRGRKMEFLTKPVPGLRIDDVEELDSGLYRCRVDLKNLPTKISTIVASVIVNPDPPMILDKLGKRIKHITKPFLEGETVFLICYCEGGNPAPVLYWIYDEDEKVSNHLQYEKNTASNTLVIKNITRSNYGQKFVCVAQNNNISVPQQSSVILDMILSPSFVEIESCGPIVSGVLSELVCATNGSAPLAIIRWHLDIGRNVLTTIQEVQKGYDEEGWTKSLMQFLPDEKDDEKIVTCIAKNPVFPELFKETSTTLNVEFVPIVSLISEDNHTVLIHENNRTVKLVCCVISNPPSYKLIWKKDGKPVQTTLHSDRKVWNATFTISNASAQVTGVYSCVVSNVQGDGVSNDIQIVVYHRPTCHDGNELLYWNTKETLIKAICPVMSHPLATKYYWYIFRNDSLSLFSVTNINYTLIPKVNHLMENFQQFNVHCRAENEIGMQINLCSITIRIIGTIHYSKFCKIINQTRDAVQMQCSVVSYEGYSKKYFHVQIYEADKKLLVQNFTSSTATFWCQQLKSDTNYFISVKIKSPKRMGVLRLGSKTWSVEGLIQESDKRFSMKKCIVAVVSSSLAVFLLIVVPVILCFLQKKKKKMKKLPKSEVKDIAHL